MRPELLHDLSLRFVKMECRTLRMYRHLNLMVTNRKKYLSQEIEEISQ
jgi:hypothetical protein